MGAIWVPFGRTRKPPSRRFYAISRFCGNGCFANSQISYYSSLIMPLTASRMPPRATFLCVILRFGSRREQLASSSAFSPANRLRFESGETARFAGFLEGLCIEPAELATRRSVVNCNS